MKKRILLFTVLMSLGLNTNGQESDAITKNELAPVRMATTVLKNSVNNSLNVLLNSSFGKSGPNLNFPIAFKGDKLDAISVKGGLVHVDDNSTPLDLTDDVITYTPPKDFAGNDLIIYQLKDKKGKVKEGQVYVNVYSSKSEDTTDLNPENSKLMMNVFPNPSNGKFTLLIFC